MTGRTVYFLIRNRNGQIWNTSTTAFEALNSASYANYAITGSEQDVTGYYTGTFPSSIVAGTYSAVAKVQIGASVAESDSTAGAGQVEWNGAALAPLSDTATSGQLGSYMPIKLARGVAVPNFPIYMVSAADHITPFTSGVISGQIARDPVSGVVWNALQSGFFTEIGYGGYVLQALTSGDLLCNTALLRFTGVSVSGGLGASDAKMFSLVLQRVSGSV